MPTTAEIEPPISVTKRLKRTIRPVIDVAPLVGETPYARGPPSSNDTVTAAGSEINALAADAAKSAAWRRAATATSVRYGNLVGRKAHAPSDQSNRRRTPSHAAAMPSTACG